MLDLLDHPARLEVRITQRFVVRIDGTTGYTGVLQPADPVARVLCQQNLLDQRLKFERMLHPVLHGGEPRFGNPAGLLHHLTAEGLPQLLVAGAHDDVAVPGAIRLVGRGQ